MKKLEKILEEIDGRIEELRENPSLEDVDICYGLNQAKDIIRKHMNDGWIPCEEFMPKEHMESRDRLDPDTLAVIDMEHNMVSDLVQCTVYDAEKDEYFVCDDCTVNGKWCNFEEVTGDVQSYRLAAASRAIPPGKEKIEHETD